MTRSHHVREEAGQIAVRQIQVTVTSGQWGDGILAGRGTGSFWARDVFRVLTNLALHLSKPNTQSVHVTECKGSLVFKNEFPFLCFSVF